MDIRKPDLDGVEKSARAYKDSLRDKVDAFHLSGEHDQRAHAGGGYNYSIPSDMADSVEDLKTLADKAHNSLSEGLQGLNAITYLDSSNPENAVKNLASMKSSLKIASQLNADFEGHYETARQIQGKVREFKTIRNISGGRYLGEPQHISEHLELTPRGPGVEELRKRSQDIFDDIGHLKEESESYLNNLRDSHDTTERMIQGNPAFYKLHGERFAANTSNELAQYIRAFKKFTDELKKFKIFITASQKLFIKEIALLNKIGK